LAATRCLAAVRWGVVGGGTGKVVAAALPRAALVLLAALQGRVPSVPEAQAAAEVPVADELCGPEQVRDNYCQRP
jgi:hypothetical protein